MPNFLVPASDMLVPVRTIVRDGNGVAITNTTATDVPVSQLLSEVTLAGAAVVGTVGSVTKVANIPAAAASTPTKAEYDAMRTALINAGLMASS